MYTYDIKNNNIAVIRYINANDLEENYFDNLSVLEEQLTRERFTIEYNLSEEVYYFEDWINYMLNNSDYSDSELMDFKDYYQNLLDFNTNLNIFITFINKNN